MNYAETARVIHTANIEVGWWDKPRNKAEMLMLTVSEISEASLGFATQATDDHLPQYEMFDVELADVAIRLFDQIGAMLSVGLPMPASAVTGQERRTIDFGDVDEQLMTVVNRLSAAMEHCRKGRDAEYLTELVGALVVTFAVADDYDIPLHEVIDAKRAYNAQRADHKPENRAKPGGKAF